MGTLQLREAFALEFAIGPGWFAAAGLLAVILFGRRWYAVVRTVPALSFTPRVARALSRIVGTRDYSYEEFLRADGAAARWVAQRDAGLRALAERLGAGRPRSLAWADAVRGGMSDLRFADANRVPFPFARVMRERFNLCSVADRSDGARLRDLDGNWSLDVSGSYGVNVAGNERYKQWVERGWARTRDLGPVVLGPLHPVVAENVALLKAISHQDEVSFHMSGTEAVMAAARLVRFNTRREKIVCFAGAYHGWWDGVQPALGSERRLGDVISLKEMQRASLIAIRARAREIAGVLVNPVQSFHPNSPPPNDAVLLTSGARRTGEVFDEYGAWLKALREVCDECGIALMFDEVYSGFRLAPGGAQQRYGVRADIVMYGKTLGGGMPVGVVCGRHDLMRRFDPARPMRLAYVVGTFSAHPLTMGAMNEFLRWVTGTEAAAAYAATELRCARFVEQTNGALAAARVPVRVSNLGTIWTVEFSAPGRYNWLLQYYLRAEGLNLSWVGTGRCAMSIDMGDDDYREVTRALVAGATAMQRDKWWLGSAEQPDRDRLMKRNLAREMMSSIVRVPRPLRAFYAEIMRRKHDDHVASHSHPVNQFMHLVSSSLFIVCYVMIFHDLEFAMWVGLGSLLLRQAGHALIEPPCHDKEQLLLGFDTRSKTVIVAGFLLIPLVNC
ncbi:MAG: aminotransferase class III-fold pyridoxal phosphate-dependent enzyme, partial [Gammaproteobacteria bacterium]